MKEQPTTATHPARFERFEQIVDLELRLCVEPGSASPHGHTRDRSGREQRFDGWLGLLSVLEHLCGPELDASPRDSQTTRNARRQTMSSTAYPPAAPIALQSGEGEALWFLGALATVKASSEATAGRVTVTELLAPRGARSRTSCARSPSPRASLRSRRRRPRRPDLERLAAIAARYGIEILGPPGIPA